jgi:hypothetical protein
MEVQPLLDVLQEEAGALIVLCSLRSGQVERELVKVPDDGLADLLVRGISRPQVRWGSAGNARDAAKGGRTKLLIFGHQKARPVPQVVKETVERPVEFMVPRDLAVSLLDVLHHVDDLAQNSVEGDNRILWSWRIGRRTGLFPRIAEVLAIRAIRSTSPGSPQLARSFDHEQPIRGDWASRAHWSWDPPHPSSGAVVHADERTDSAGAVMASSRHRHHPSFSPPLGWTAPDRVLSPPWPKLGRRIQM